MVIGQGETLPEYEHTALFIVWISTHRRSDEKKEACIIYRNLKVKEGISGIL